MLQIDFAEKLENDKGRFGVGFILNQFNNVLVMKRFRNLVFVLEEADFHFVSALLRTQDLKGVTLFTVISNGFPDLAGASKTNQSRQAIRAEEVSNFDHREEISCWNTKVELVWRPPALLRFCQVGMQVLRNLTNRIARIRF